MGKLILMIIPMLVSKIPSPTIHTYQLRHPPAVLLVR